MRMYSLITNFRKSILNPAGWITTSLLLTVFFAQSCSPYDTHATSGIGEKPNIFLSDGSFAILNAGSTLRYNSKDFAEKRIVELEGEALFTVKRGNGFLCKTDYGLVRVLGTNFNVYTRNDGFEVTCYLGKVEVRYQDQIMELNMNEKATWKADQFVKEIDYNEQPDWMQDASVYKNAPYTKVIAELERQFGLKVKLDITGNPPFTGSFSHKTLQEAMDNIVKPYGYRYKQDGQIMRIWEP